MPPASPNDFKVQIAEAVRRNGEKKKRGGDTFTFLIFT